MSENEGRTLLSLSEEAKWRKRHTELNASKPLAPLFRGWIPNGYFAPGKPRILYVGKATSGSFEVDEPERAYFNCGRSFWTFARRIATAVGCDEDSLSCIAWSNLSKVSLRQVAAEPSLIRGFEEDAATSIEDEITTTDPDVIVFVTQHFSDVVVRTVAEGHDDSAWEKSERESRDPNVGDVWWKRRRDGKRVLWMRHPMGAHRDKLAYAAAKIASLAHPPVLSPNH